jgi:hypothetical protein
VSMVRVLDNLMRKSRSILEVVEIMPCRVFLRVDDAEGVIRVEEDFQGKFVPNHSYEVETGGGNQGRVRGLPILMFSSVWVLAT